MSESHQYQCIYVRKFTTESAAQFHGEVDYLIAEEQPVIPVYINSPGGYASACRAMLDVVDMARAHNIPVATIAIGQCASAGALLLAAGTKGLRFAAPRASLMVHGASGGAGGKLHDVLTDAEVHARLDAEAFAHLDSTSGKRAGYWQRLLAKRHMADLYMTPDEALKHGLVDHVHLPRFRPKDAPDAEVMFR